MGTRASFIRQLVSEETWAYSRPSVQYQIVDALARPTNGSGQVGPHRSSLCGLSVTRRVKLVLDGVHQARMPCLLILCTVTSSGFSLPDSNATACTFLDTIGGRSDTAQTSTAFRGSSIPGAIREFANRISERRREQSARGGGSESCVVAGFARRMMQPAAYMGVLNGMDRTSEAVRRSHRIVQ